MIFDELSELITALLGEYSAREVAVMFNREKKAIYRWEQGCGFQCNTGFVRGLNKLGYDLQLVPLGASYAAPIPLLDIRMMSDERERELARKAVTA